MSHADPSLCYFGAEAILNRLEVMVRLTQKVCANDDIEAVHDMRVASRRARTALELFVDCFQAKKARSWNKQLRRVTRALGHARDTDVQIEVVQGCLKGVHDRNRRQGLRRLLLRLQQQRQRLQADMNDVLDRFGRHDDLAEMQATLLQYKAHGQLHHLTFESEPVYQYAHQAIASRLEEMLAYEPYVSRPESVEQLHEMRIAAKHLRYTMEIFSPLYDAALEEPIHAAKEVQRHLGEIHDCDVWIAFLPVFVEQEQERTVEFLGRPGPARQLLPGINHLRQDRQTRRDEEYRAFAGAWQDLQKQGVWSNLLAVLDKHPNVSTGNNPCEAPAHQESVT